jgi:hypothetical protein
MLLIMGVDLVVRPARHMSRGKGRGGGGRWRVHGVSWMDLEPVRYGMGEEGEVKVREVGVKDAVPSDPRSEDTPKREYVSWESGMMYAVMGGREGRFRDPPLMALMGGPFPAWERVRGGTG